MMKQMLTNLNNINEEANSITSTLNSHWMKIRKNDEQLIHTSGNRYINGSALIMALTFDTRRRIQKTPQGKQQHAIEKKNPCSHQLITTGF